MVEPFTLQRSPRARHARLTIRPDGELVVTLPARAPERWASELVDTRGAWIERHRSRLLADRERLATRPALGAGRLVPFGGVGHRLSVVPLAAGRRRTRIVHDDAGEPSLVLERAADDLRSTAEILEAWLRGEAREAIARRIAIRAPALQVQPRALSIRDQRSRWGSASRRGTLSFSWRLILAPATILDYVVVHELAHLRVFGHGPRFWALVHDVVPDADAARRWLKAKETELRAALD
jgi:hypothetical protein